MSRVLVTGGSKGIGFAVGQALAERGHALILVARDAEDLERATGALPGSGHEWHAFDVSVEDAWKQLALDELHGLVCAAAVLSPVGVIGDYEPVEFRRTLEINVLGTFLAVHYCVDALRAGSGHIVTFGGGGATSPLPRYDAYAASKAAVARLSENLALTLAPMTVNCVAPGFVATGMHEATLAAGPETAGSEYYDRTRRELDAGGFTATEAAELVCLLLSGVSFTGKLISAEWDPWRDPAFHRRLASEPSLATLRRIDAVLFDSVGEPE